MGVKGLILAAGRGSRLGHLTEQRPKCLVEIGGYSLIDRQIDALSKGGAFPIAVVAGYLQHLLDFPKIERFINLRWAATNMVGSLLCARSWLENSKCVVSYSDIFYPPSAVSELISSAADIAITYDPDWLDLWRQRFSDPLSDAESFVISDDGTLLEIGNKATCSDEIQGQYMGLLYFSAGGWRIIADYAATLGQSDIDQLSMTGLLSRLIDVGVAIKAVPIHGRWGEIDSPEDLELYRSWFEV